MTSAAAASQEPSEDAMDLAIKFFPQAGDDALDEIAALLDAFAANAIAAERERCALLMETYPDQTLRIWDRPGGPPGNGYAPTTNSDRAAAIRDEHKP